MEPILLMLTGLGGAGKSTTAARLLSILRSSGYDCELIEFDAFRKMIAPPGVDPFDGDVEAKRFIYGLAAEKLAAKTRSGKSLIVDACVAVESIRLDLKRKLPALRLVHIDCPMWCAFLRETLRSLHCCPHERGHYLYLHAALDLVN